MKSKSTAQTPDAILHDLHAMIAEAERMVNDKAAEHSEEAVSTLRGRLDAAQERLTELYANAKQHVSAGAKYTDEAIRTHPYESVAVAAGIGLLVGLLVGRNR
jgi:ElaB/YqjD/DUF883 family membrane-anchored ribosome-binding protein